MGTTVGELHAMLIEYEKGLPKKAETPQVMMIKGGKIQKSNKKSLKAKGKGKANGKGKDKQVYIPKPKNPKPSAKKHPAKDDTCHHGKEVGHCKRNCPTYLAELIKKKKQVGTASSSDVFIIELFSFPTKSWVYDTSCGTHICNTKHGLEGLALKEPNIILDSNYLWNCHLAHISKKRIEKLQQEGLLRSTDDESFDQCVSCLSGKMTRKSFPHRPERATDLLGIIHTDVCGPLRHVSRQGASYFITGKSLNIGKTIKALRSDRGGEYISQFKDYLKACGIVQQLTPPYTPQHNGVSERRNRTLLDMVRSMMNLTTLPLSFWDYALESATRILNMVPTKKVDKTPYELWYGKVPNLSYLKVWGCEALVKRDTPDKFQPRSIKFVARYAEFFEKNLITQEVSGRAIDLEEIQDEDTSPSEITSEIPMEVEGFEPPQEEEIPIRRSERSRQVPNRLCLNVEINVMNAEIQSMMDNMVWVLVDLPPGCKTVGKKYASYKDSFMDLSKHQEAGIKDLMRKSKDWFCAHQTNLDEPYKSKSSGSNVTFLICAVDWKSSKQSTTAMSATEAEYIAASEAAMKAVWIRKFISGLGIVPTINEPIRMFCDNSAALHFANEPGVQRGARHYHRRYHYVRESIALGEIRFLKVHTDDNLADPFTKALSKGKLTQHARSMGLRLASSFM
ncbi:retrotransposon protein, putative, ty1-copia subclass [Tanacetum coccineum]